MPTQWSEAKQVPLGYIAPHTAPRCHSEPVTDVTGVGIRSPRRGAEHPFLSGKKVPRRRQKEKENEKRKGGVNPRPYAHFLPSSISPCALS